MERALGVILQSQDKRVRLIINMSNKINLNKKKMEIVFSQQVRCKISVQNTASNHVRVESGASSHF